MNFIRENLLKIVIISGILILITILLVSCSGTKDVPVEEEYTRMEENLTNAAKELASKSSRFLPKVGEEKSIKMSTLVSNEMISDLHAIEDSNISCSGYVLVQHKSKKSYKFIPHLKCGKYYETKTIGDYIIEKEKVVTENDGLYQNGVGYVFRGENPNNNIIFDDELYKIISITPNNEIKIISTESYSDNVVWDDRYNSEFEDYEGINIFEKSRLKEYLEEIYNNDEYLSKAAKSFIVPHDICIGRRSENEITDLTGNLECSEVSKNQKIGIVQTNEYLNASIDSKCVSTDNLECGNYNYFTRISSYMVTQNASKDNSSDVYIIRDGALQTVRSSINFSVYPVFYLDKNTLYKGGKGTETNPYIIR